MSLEIAKNTYVELLLNMISIEKNLRHGATLIRFLTSSPMKSFHLVPSFPENFDTVAPTLRKASLPWHPIHAEMLNIRSHYA
jgi:hypothetical protein